MDCEPKLPMTINCPKFENISELKNPQSLSIEHKHTVNHIVERKRKNQIIPKNPFPYRASGRDTHVVASIFYPGF